MSAQPEVDIISVKDLLTKKLSIPEYQRPYKWTPKHVNQLIDDVLHFNNKDAYRLGTVVLYDNNSKLDIVDGQQRTITLLLIALAINKKIDNLIDFEFTNDISKYHIKNNYQEIERRVSDFDEKTIKFLFDSCEVVIVILKDLSEAFQFFDSQNARGKDLAPHDLLKAYHLREMSDIDEKTKSDTIREWEKIDQDELSKLFSHHLYRIRSWSKGRSARYFNKSDIEIFKGINLMGEQHYPYYKLYTTAHYYTDAYMKSCYSKIENKPATYPFQIDTPIINGKRFFEFIGYYHGLLKKIKKYDNEDNEIVKILDEYEGKNRTGDKYTRVLFDNALLYYVDKFGEVELDKAIEKIFIWAYSLRLKQHSVQIASMDNYARENVELFSLIREASSHKEIINLHFTPINIIPNDKTQKIKEKFKDLHYVIKQ